jgi:hypothetical protein
MADAASGNDMRATILRIVVMAITTYASCALAAEPKFIDPERTDFKSTFDGRERSCNLAITAVKAPITVLMNVTARRNGYSLAFGYEVKAHSAEGPLKIKEAVISFDAFAPGQVVRRTVADSARYTLKEAAVGAFTETMARGWFYLSLELQDGGSLRYIIRDDEKLSEAASNTDAIKQWDACRRIISKPWLTR